MSGGFKEENTPGRHQRTTRRSNTTAGFGRLSAKLRSGQGSFPSEFFVVDRNIIPNNPTKDFRDDRFTGVPIGTTNPFDEGFLFLN
ncbi:hypothetical protein V2G26_019618 [Clonostachys chloroleuca]